MFSLRFLNKYHMTTDTKYHWYCCTNLPKGFSFPQDRISDKMLKWVVE